MPEGVVVVDRRAFSRFARALKVADAALAKDMRKGLRAAGELVAADARKRAPGSRIPSTIKVRVSGARVSVVAGGSPAPEAKPIENRGKGHVRHPVFGNSNVWTDRNSPPAFLHPALEANREEAVHTVALVLDGVVRKLAADSTEA